MIRCVISDCHDGQRGIEPTIVHVHAAIDHEEIVHVVDPAVLIDHRSLGIVAHAAGAGLVLAAAQARAGQERPSGNRSRLF